VLRGGELTTVPDPVVPDPALLDPGLALATSGVSGRPRVAQRDWATVGAGAAALATAIGLGADDTLLCTTPVHHAYAFVAGMVGCLLSGATYIAPRTPVSPAALAELCERHGVTVLFSVPALYRWYLEGPPLPRPPRLAVAAGERLAPELVAGWERRYGRPLRNHYGSTELGMLSFEPDGAPGSVGLPLAGVRVTIAGGAEAGEVVAEPVGEPALLLGLEAGVRKDARAARAFRTGDLGRLGDDGRLYIEGRVGETIDLGGQKVVPAEVEEAIHRYGPVCDCAVVGGPDRDGVPRLCAFVAAGDGFDRGELRSRLSAELAPFKVPSVVTRLDAIPRSAGGKVLRSRLTELAVAPGG
jgi:acyl-coenzyme A synthetase/AMP-(fatty) acid ligase